MNCDTRDNVYRDLQNVIVFIRKVIISLTFYWLRIFSIIFSSFDTDNITQRDQSKNVITDQRVCYIYHRIVMKMQSFKCIENLNYTTKTYISDKSTIYMTTACILYDLIFSNNYNITWLLHSTFTHTSPKYDKQKIPHSQSNS